ncbi:MAG TPA: hypothetical protein VGG91_14220 [Myxococcaceae bacterium]|jgi:hypothetical protein
MWGTPTLVLLAALGGGTGVSGDAPAGLIGLRESAREALKTSCGRCHDRAKPTAKPEALRIFDLDELDWSARVTDVQMDHMVGRFEGFHMPEADRVTVRRYLDAERARRASAVVPATSDWPHH